MDSLIFITLLKDIKLFREKILSSAIFLWLKRKSEKTRMSTCHSPSKSEPFAINHQTDGETLKQS